MKIVVLSPHRDDAAFSLSLAISQWLASAHTVTLLNCFTRSLYAPYSDAEQAHPNDQLSYISAMRRKEDELFLRQVPGATAANIHMVDLNIKDAPLRLHCSSDIVCDMAVDPADSAIVKIRKGIDKLMQAGSIDALVLPLALGHHVDHRTARDASLPYSLERPCAFYEDLPYATRQGVRVDLDAFRNDASTRLHEPLFPVFCQNEAGVALKKRLALGYASQIDEAAADLISGFAGRYDQGERLWANAAWLAISESAGLSAPQMETQQLPG